jgi:hypothetical protein
MKTTHLILAGTVLLLVVMAPPQGGAQSNPPQAATGLPADVGGLAPARIIASVRSAGFDPLSRPVQRGGVYFLFAVDRQYMDVRLTVDANTGRVLSATRVAGMRLGGPGFEGREALSRAYERPVPPGDIPNHGAGRNGGSAAAPRPPLPRARPSDIVTGSVIEPDLQTLQTQAEPAAAASPAGLGDTTVASPPSSAPPPPPQPPQPTMVPIAPLE